MSLLKNCKKVAFKTLSSVEIDNYGSNQHEFHGAMAFREVLGECRRDIYGTIHIIQDNSHLISVPTKFTWYDAREANPDRSAEYRFYYTHQISVFQPQVGNLLIVSEDINGKIVVIIVDNSKIIPKIQENISLFKPLFYNNGSSYFANLKDVPFLMDLI